jgi:hypothetical protein
MKADEKQDLTPREYKELVELTGRFTYARTLTSGAREREVGLTPNEEARRRYLERRLDQYGRA